MSSETLVPPKPKAPAPPPKPAPPPAKTASPIDVPNKTFQVIQGTIDKITEKIGITGKGGIGKSELASLLGLVGFKVLFFDLESGSSHLNVARINSISTFEELLAALSPEGPMKDFDVGVLDSSTVIQELIEAFVVRTIPHEKGEAITSLDSYGWGQGYAHVYDTFLRLLSALDALVRRGKHIVIICHDCLTEVINTSGENYFQHQPRLQSPPKGKSSVRHKLIEWLNHLFYIEYDLAVSKEGKGVGSGTRTIYCQEMPAFLAKSRTLSNPIPYERGSADLWKQLFGKE